MMVSVLMVTALGIATTDAGWVCVCVGARHGSVVGKPRRVLLVAIDGE